MLVPATGPLSPARADAGATGIRAELPASRRVRAVGKGDTDPIATNATPAGREQNRRTEVVLLKTSNLP